MWVYISSTPFHAFKGYPVNFGSLYRPLHYNPFGSFFGVPEFFLARRRFKPHLDIIIKICCHNKSFPRAGTDAQRAPLRNNKLFRVYRDHVLLIFRQEKVVVFSVVNVPRVRELVVFGGDNFYIIGF